MAGRYGVVVTGMGGICAAGADSAAIWRSAQGGRANASWLEARSRPIPVYRVATLPTTEHPLLNVRRADRTVLLAMTAATEAVRQAGFAARPPRPERLGVFMGTSRGPIDAWDRTVRSADPGRHPTLLAGGTIGSLSGALSIAFGARGPNMTVSASCASAAHAIAMAADQIASGALDAAIAGGSDSPLHPALLEQFRAAGLLGTHEDAARACRPFDRSRDGTVLGEGAGVLVLERADAARRRGVREIAALRGWGLTSDAVERVNVSDDGLRRAIVLACERAMVDDAAIGYVNSHGTGTVQNDLCESRVLASLLRPGIPCSSTKPVTGHCAGATPALEAMLSIQMLLHNLAPPTTTCGEPDPDCPIDPIVGAPREIRAEAVLSTSLGIWGNNAALILSRPGT